MEGPTVWELVLKTVGVLLLIAPALWVLRRLQGPALPARTRHIQVLETRALAQGQVLYLVRVGGQHLLLSGTRGGVSLLSEIAGLPAAAEAPATPTLAQTPWAQTPWAQTPIGAALRRLTRRSAASAERAS